MVFITELHVMARSKMMKFLLGFIAIILISLIVYMNMDSSSKEAKHGKMPKVEEAEVVTSTEKTSEILPNVKAKVKQKDTLPKEKRSSKKEVDVSELAEEAVYDPNAEKTSDDPISDKEWVEIENSLDLSDTDNENVRKNSFDPELATSDTSSDEEEPDLTSDTSLSAKELKEIEESLPEQEIADIQPIENDDLAELAESSENQLNQKETK